MRAFHETTKNLFCDPTFCSLKFIKKVETNFDRIVRKFELCFWYLDALQKQRLTGEVDGGGGSGGSNKPFKSKVHRIKLQYYWLYLRDTIYIERNLVSVCSWDLERECEDRQIERAPANKEVLAQFELATEEFIRTKDMTILAAIDNEMLPNEGE